MRRKTSCFVRCEGDAEVPPKGSPREVGFYIIAQPQAAVWKADLLSGCWTGEQQ